MFLEQLKCNECGAPIDRATLKCPYCGAVYRDRQLGEVRYIRDRAGTVKLYGRSEVDVFLPFSNEDRAKIAARDITNRVAEALLPYMTFEQYYEVERHRHIVTGIVTVVEPIESSGWFER